MIVGVTSTPFKCPPAPSETALLMHDYLVGARAAGPVGDLARHALAGADPAVARGSEALLAAFAERGIDWHPAGDTRARPGGQRGPVRRRRRDALRPVPRRPVHRAPAVVRSRAGRRRLDPGQPADARDLVPGVYAVGDVTSVGTPKAGVFAEGQAAVAAIAASRSIHGTGHPEYDGRGLCYLEFGHDEVARVEVTFLSGQPPAGNYRRAIARR